MEPYVFNANAAKQYQKMMGGALPLDKYIFNAQDGSGIGSFFAPLLKAVIPIAKTLGASLLKSAKPIAKAAGREAINTMGQAVANSLSKKTTQRVQRKRKASTNRRTRVKRRAL